MRNKISNFIKQYFFMLALAATFVGFSAFKSVESKRTTLWYGISASHPTDPNQDMIGAENPDQTGCTEAVQTYRCAIQIDNPNDEDLEGLTIQQALLQFPELSVGPRTYKSTP